MHPEAEGDRLQGLEDFGELVAVSPAAGGRLLTFAAIFNQAARRSALDVEGVSDVEVIATEPHLIARREDAAELAQGSLVEIPSEGRQRYRVHTVEPEDEDGRLVRVDLLEAEV